MNIVRAVGMICKGCAKKVIGINEAGERAFVAERVCKKHKRDTWWNEEIKKQY